LKQQVDQEFMKQVISRIRILVEEQGKLPLLDILLPQPGSEADLLTQQGQDSTIDEKLQDLLNETRDMIERYFPLYIPLMSCPHIHQLSTITTTNFLKQTY
jgi:hypothetical protein